MSHWWEDITFSNSLSWQDYLLKHIGKQLKSAWWFMCQFSPFYAWRCTLNAVSSHGWLTLTDVRDISVFPFASHMWEVENRPICAYRRVFTRMQHLMPQWILRMCVYIIASTCRKASITDNNCRQATDTFSTPMLPQPVQTYCCVHPRN